MPYKEASGEFVDDRLAPFYDYCRKRGVQCGVGMPRTINDVITKFKARFEFYYEEDGYHIIAETQLDTPVKHIKKMVDDMVKELKEHNEERRQERDNDESTDGEAPL